MTIMTPNDAHLLAFNPTAQSGSSSTQANLACAERYRLLINALVGVSVAIAPFFLPTTSLAQR
ncbi:MAG: hypothetical protein F6K16_33075 [Symploca sp. SIO2B6]|nr:hypothetical protein [Symploca sp. SIO2B6]